MVAWPEVRGLRVERRAEVVVIRFRGLLPRASFADFAAHRAARLSLDHRMLLQDDGEAVIAVTGHEVLVDAFELALSLGPQDCIVREIDRPGALPPGTPA